MAVLWSVLFLWSCCVHVTSDGSRKLQIKEVDICPTDQISWEKASRDVNCTNPDRYQCTPNENLTALLEYCYHQPPTFVEKGFCWIISDSYFTNTYSCSGFKEGCPHMTYRSNELYKYQECLQLNKLKGCYLADPKCPSLGKGTTTPSTTKRNIDDTFSSRIFIWGMISGASIIVIVIFAIFVIRKLIVCKSQEGSPDEELSLLSGKKVEAVDENVVLRCLLPINHRIIQARHITWFKDGEIINLKNATEKYSIAEERQAFVIENANRLDIGEYVCGIKYSCNCMGMDENVTFKLECPGIILGEIKTDGEDVIIEYTVSVSEDCKPMTSISWKRNGSDLILSDESENYSGGTLDDFCLRISNIKEECFGKYECTVRNVFGEMTSHFTLDDIQCRSRECQSFLLCCLLLDKCQPNKNEPDDFEEKLKISWKFCCGDYERNITMRVLTAISNGKLEDHINCENNEYKLLSRDLVFQSFLRKSGFVDFFLQHACSKSISIYCRSPGYKKDPFEICCTLTPEQFKVVVQRLKFEILTNDFIKDKTCHPIIEDVLNIPKGILSLGSESISRFLKDLTHGEHVVYVARGMVVGCEGAGKTSLVCRLRGEEIPNPLSTRGIDVHVNLFTVDGKKIEVTTNPSLASLRSTLNQKDRADDHDQNINVSANRLSGRSTPRKENVKSDKMSTNILPTLSEINNEHVAEIRNQRESRVNEETFKNIIMDEEDDDEKLTDDILSVDSNVPTSVDTDIPTEFSITQTLSESFVDENGKIITIFDFAGQFAYYACHHLYFSPNDFYILVMDITKNLNDRVITDKAAETLKQGDLHQKMCDGRSKMERSMYDNWTYLEYTKYWLQSILSYSVGITPTAMEDDNKPSKAAPLILVATHAEEKTKKDVEDYFRDLRDRIPIMSVHIDYNNAFCTGYWGQNANLEEIKNGIIEIVKTLPNWGKRIPLSWFYIETLVRKLSSFKIINTDELLRRCSASGVGVEKKEDLITPLLFLHNTGVVLFFDEENLRDFIILDVQWFVDAFKNVITDENHAKRDIPQDLYEKWKMFNNNGLLTSSLLSSIWKKCEKNDKYNAKKTEIVSMMIRLNVLAEVTPSTGRTILDEWYCPCMNKQTFPTEEFENFQNSSLLCFKFTFLPKDLFHRLIAACSNKLKWKILKMKCLCIYQTAAVFYVERNKVLIGMHSNDKILIQYLDLPRHLRADFLDIRRKITRLIDGLTKKLVHCAYEIGYMCKNQVFGKSNLSHSHFIAESHMEEDNINCSECGFIRKMDVKDIIWDEATVPDLTFDKNTCHRDVFISSDGKVFKSINPFEQTVIFPSNNHLLKYKGAICSPGFMYPGRHKYAIKIEINVKKPIDKQNLVFELGIARKSVIGKSLIVEGEKYAWSMIGAHHVDCDAICLHIANDNHLLYHEVLTSNVAGSSVERNFGFLLDTEFCQWTVFDWKLEREICVVEAVDCSEMLYPLVAGYNPSSLEVTATIIPFD